MGIVVSELPIHDALGRARARLRDADARLSEALADATAGLSWAAGGALALALGAVARAGGLPLAGDAALGAAIAPLVLGGVFLGYGLPRCSRARRAKRERTRQWQHALELLRLREQQARESPGMTVEVLDRVEARHAGDLVQWPRPTCAEPRYVQ